MLTVEGVVGLLASSQPLPQQSYGVIADTTVDALQASEPGVVNTAIRMLQRDGSVDAVRAEVDKLCERYGWYPAGAVMALIMAGRYSEETLPDIPALTGDTRTLFQIFALAARAQGTEDGAWTVPLAMFASLGEEQGRAFVTCSALFAAYAIFAQAARSQL